MGTKPGYGRKRTYLVVNILALLSNVIVEFLSITIGVISVVHFVCALSRLDLTMALSCKMYTSKIELDSALSPPRLLSATWQQTSIE